MLPKVPIGEDSKRGRHLGLDHGWSIVGIEATHARARWEAVADHLPEAPGKGALEEDVVSSLECGIAEGAPGLRRSEDVLS